MRRSISIDGVNHELASNAFTPIAYKAEFGRDYFSDLLSMFKNEESKLALAELVKNPDIDPSQIDLSILADFDMTFFNRMFWVLAKSANPKINPYQEFFMSMESFPINEVAPLIMEMISQETTTSKKLTQVQAQAMNLSR